MDSQLNHREFTKQFIDFVEERYPSSERTIRMLSEFGVDAMPLNPTAKLKIKIAILSMFRDAIREVDPDRIFQSIQHRDEIYDAFIEALEELEEELEELEEEEETFEYLETEEEAKETKEEKPKKKGFWDITEEDFDKLEEDEWWKDEKLL